MGARAGLLPTHSCERISAAYVIRHLARCPSRSPTAVSSSSSHRLSCFAASTSFLKPAGSGFGPRPVTQTATSTARSTTGRVEITAKDISQADGISEWLSEVYDAIDYAEVFEKTETAAEGSDHGDCVDDEDDEVIYGESSLPLVCALLRELDASAQGVFIDVGSGRGQVVLAAARACSWKACIGVEILPELHYMATSAYAVAKKELASENASRPDEERPRLSCCSFLLGDMYHCLSQINFKQLRVEDSQIVVFLYATKFKTLGPPHEDCLLLSAQLHELLPAGATVISVNKKLLGETGFEMLSEGTGPNPEGGDLTVYTWKVVK